MPVDRRDVAAAATQSRGGDGDDEGDGDKDDGGMEKGDWVKSKKANEDDSDDDSMKEEDQDAGASKELDQHKQERDYDGEEDEIAELLGDEESVHNDDEPDDGESIGAESEDSDSEEYKMDRVGSQSVRKRLSQLKKERTADPDATRVQAVLSVPCVSGYAYDTDEELWCQVTFKFPLSSSEVDITPLVQSVAASSLVCDTGKLVRGINKAFLTEPKTRNEPLRLRTEGVNIHKMFQYDTLLDLNNLYTNDIHAMADNYGIEAACRVLMKEVRDVFAAYGITVNYRHLSLIADYMTFDGQYKAFNRTGLMASASTLQKVTYESSTTFLKSSMLAGTADDVESPSARIVVGRPVKVGTGLFDCITQIEE